MQSPCSSGSDLASPSIELTIAEPLGGTVTRLEEASVVGHQRDWKLRSNALRAESGNCWAGGNWPAVLVFKVRNGCAAGLGTWKMKQCVNRALGRRSRRTDYCEHPQPDGLRLKETRGK